MSADEFWQMPPLFFSWKLDGYLARENRPRSYYRELYALLVNINRDPKKSSIEGKQVAPLLGEKPMRVPSDKHADTGGYSPKELEQIRERIKATVQ